MVLLGNHKLEKEAATQVYKETIIKTMLMK